MAEFRSGIKWLLFFSSYIPLYIILAIKHRGITVTIPGYNPGLELPVISFGWILLAVLSGAILKAVFSLRRSKGGDDIQSISSYQNRDDLITNYILVYIFPFVVLNYTNLANWLAFLIFFLVIGVVQTRSNHLYVNPVLAFFDYHIYEVDTGERILTVLTKEELDGAVSSVRTVELSNDVHLTV